MWTFRPDPSRLNPGRLNGHPTPRRHHLLAGVLVVATVAIAGCGAGSTGAETGRGPTPTTTASPDAAPNPGPGPSPADPSSAPDPGPSGLPHVVVNDVGADVKVDLATLSPGGQPLLVWFWAPH